MLSGAWFRSFLKKLFYNTPSISVLNENSSRPNLGRWSHLKNKKDLDTRIYLANIDHCGCCDKK